VITRPTAATARLALARTINGSSTVAMAVQASSPADSVAAVPPDSVAPAVPVPAGADNGSQAPSLVLRPGRNAPQRAAAAHRPVGACHGPGSSGISSSCETLVTL